jgi:hypothetical protein
MNAEENAAFDEDIYEEEVDDDDYDEEYDEDDGMEQVVGEVSEGEEEIGAEGAGCVACPRDKRDLGNLHAPRCGGNRARNIFSHHVPAFLNAKPTTRRRRRRRAARRVPAARARCSTSLAWAISPWPA